MDPRFDDLPAYALNALSPAERAAVDALLARSPEARRQLAELQEGTDLLVATVPAVDPPPHLRARILSHAALDVTGALREAQEVLDHIPEPEEATFGERLRDWFRPARMAYSGASMAMATAIAFAVFFGLQTSRLGNEVNQLEGTLAQQVEIMDRLEQDLTSASTVAAEQIMEVNRLTEANTSLQASLRDQRWLTYVSSNQSWQVPNWFQGNQIAPSANGALAVKRSSNDAVFLVSGLPSAPIGHYYQLWMVTRDGTPLQGAGFQVDEFGQANVPFEMPGLISEFSGAFVTLETWAKQPGSIGYQVLISETQ